MLCPYEGSPHDELFGWVNGPRFRHVKYHHYLWWKLVELCDFLSSDQTAVAYSQGPLAIGLVLIVEHPAKTWRQCAEAGLQVGELGPPVPTLLPPRATFDYL